MKLRLFALACVTAVALGLAPASAQDRDGDAQIRAAVRRGVQFLKTQQRVDGSWEYGSHELGITALVGLALAENGVAATDPVMKQAVEFVRSRAASNVMTYDISLAILFLSRAGDSSDTQLIMELGSRLVAGQLSSGGWHYVCPIIPATPPASVTNNPKAKGAAQPRRGGRIQGPSRVPQAGFGDNSNTQFGVLGVWAAGRAGLDVSATMQRVERRFRTTQSQQGGWGYGGGGDTDAMTCAGLMCLALAKGHKVVEAQMTNQPPAKDGAAPPGKGPKMESDADLEQGIQRVETYVGGIHARSSLYFLWSVERVGVALGLARIGRVDWYSRGASVLVQTQQPNGSWQSDRGAMADTSFALLFLRRSNLAEGMPQLVSSSRSGGTTDNRLRAGTLEELIQTVKPTQPPDEKKK